MQESSDSLNMIQQYIEAELSVSERELCNQDVFWVANSILASDKFKEFPRNVFEGNGRFEVKESSAFGVFAGGQGSYQIKVNLPASGNDSNGLSVSFKISGWKSIRYVAIGHTSNGMFRHSKIFNIKQNEKVAVNLGYADIAFGLQNKWEKPEAEQINDIRVYVSGEADTGDASIEVYWLSRWFEDSGMVSRELEKYPIKKNEQLFHALKKYFRSCNPHLDTQAETFLQTGKFPVAGNVYLDWSHYLVKPENLKDSGSYAYTWHAMHFAISLMVFGVDHNRTEAVIAARDFINEWLSNSYYQADADKKYTWYDHGTAERLIAFIFMHHLGLLYHFDFRFMYKLRYAIVKHTQLLESEVFYSYHQNTRYHNHAWFQDMSLIAASVALSDWPAAKRWLHTGKTRLEDQLNTLIVRDSGFAVFIENSIGYHLGVQRLTEFAGTLVSLANIDSEISTISAELSAWSNFFKYPDYSYPATGDSFKKNTAGSVNPGKCLDITGLSILDKAGYAVLKYNFKNKPMMLTMLGTSLCETHKHEDNLALTVFYEGVEWLTDPSFYSHKYDSPIPAYLRRAESHNCIYIPESIYCLEPGLSSIGGNEGQDHWSISGEHHCYQDTKVSRVLHISKETMKISAVDEVFSRKSPVSAFLIFHFGIGVCVTEADGGFKLSHKHSCAEAFLRINVAQYEIVFGLSNPLRCSVIGLGFEEYVESYSLCVEMKCSQVDWSLEFL